MTNEITSRSKGDHHRMHLFISPCLTCLLLRLLAITLQLLSDILYSVQVITDVDLAAGLELLADKLCKPSLSNGSSVKLEIPEKCRRRSVNQSAAAIVTVPAEATSFSDESQSATAANQATLVTGVSAADWQTLVSQLQAGTLPTVLDVAADAQNTAFVLPSLTQTMSGVTSIPPAKKVIRLVAKRSSTSTLSQSQSSLSSCTDCSKTVASSKYRSVLLRSADEANSTMTQLAALQPDLLGQELVASGTTGSLAGYLGSLGGQ